MGPPASGPAVTRRRPSRAYAAAVTAVVILPLLVAGLGVVLLARGRRSVASEVDALRAEMAAVGEAATAARLLRDEAATRGPGSFRPPPRPASVDATGHR